MPDRTGDKRPMTTTEALGLGLLIYLLVTVGREETRRAVEESERLGRRSPTKAPRKPSDRTSR